jgi:two-component system sensor histidine kinase BarA
MSFIHEFPEKMFNITEALERLDNDEEFLTELIVDLIELADSSIQQMSSALDGESFAKVTEIAHGLKGAAANLAFPEMVSMARDIELNENTDTMYIRSLITGLENHLQEIKSYIKTEQA